MIALIFLLLVDLGLVAAVFWIIGAAPEKVNLLQGLNLFVGFVLVIAAVGLILFCALVIGGALLVQAAFHSLPKIHPGGGL